jgi:cupin 2 domain-containing protein
MTNLFSNLPASRDQEAVEEILRRPGFRIERIVSHGQASPPGLWYDQPESEFVVLLSGAARLRFEDEAADRELKPGDYCDIPAGRRHRVEWTDPEQATVWLAIFYAGEQRCGA